MSTGKSLLLIFFAILLCYIVGQAQSTRWIYRDSTGRANSISYGEDGNLYAAGAIEGDFAIVSLNQYGQERWRYRYNGPANDNDCANSIICGTDGNIYAAGFSYGTGYDFTIISLTPTGNQRWVYCYNGPINSYDEATSIVFGADGNIYVAGSCRSNNYFDDLIVISLTSNGTQRWLYCYNGPSNGWDRATSLVYGNDNNIYVAGWSEGVNAYEDFIVISLTRQGAQRWLYRYNGPESETDYASSLAYGVDGNIYVAGGSTGNGTETDFTIISINSNGQERWRYRYNGSGNSTDEATCIVCDNDRNIYVGGKSASGFWNSKFTTISLDTSGTQRWIYCYNNPASYDECYSIIYGEDGNVYAAGECYGTEFDFTIISLTSIGTERWVYRYNGPGNDWDRANSLDYGNDGNIYAAGWSYGVGNWDFTVLSLNPAIISIEEETTASPPFFTVTCFGRKIELFMNLAEFYTIPISLYNITGKKVFSYDLHAQKGKFHYQHNLSFLPSGVYVFRVDLEGRSITKKYIILK